MSSLAERSALTKWFVRSVMLPTAEGVLKFVADHVFTVLFLNSYSGLAVMVEWMNKEKERAV